MITKTPQRTTPAVGRLDYFAFGPDAMQALLGLDRRGAASDLPGTLIALVRLRVAQINRSAYCIDQHARAASDAGVDGRKLTLLPVWRQTTLFTERERAALEWTESLTLVADTHAPDACWESVQAVFIPSQLVDLTLVITAANSWNRFAIGFRKVPV